MKKTEKARQRAYKLTASMLALAAGAGLAVPANAQTPDVPGPDNVWSAPTIVVNDTVTANGNPPGGAWDNTNDITGVGQMTVRVNPAATSMSLCSGTLINPRTVLFAAHCVNTRPASAYGPNGTPVGPWTTGTPIAFGFRFDNLPAVRQWLGLDPSPVGIHQTNVASALYAVEHVWYDPRSLAPSSFGFLEADIALATLDTPAQDIPTWALLFTPLQDETHGVINGYGVNGTNTSAAGPGGPCGTCGPVGSIDWRRRAAENMISFLGSLDDVDDWLFGPSPTPINPQTLYQLDFDSQAGEASYTGAFPNYDFDLFNGTTLPREGTTAGGDSGGPLIADQYFDDRSVVVATLSGGSRFHNNQRFSTYGTSSFYQPLFMFWEEIVANNPYVYAGNKAGIRSWTDPSHWVQLMDPVYGVEVDGEWVNALPGVGSYGVSGATPRFGEVCFLADCTDNALDDEATPWTAGTPNTIYVPGGPGTVNFVPNNVVANPALNIRPRYYDVTLSAHGVTWLSSTVTVDRLTVDGGLTALDVRSSGVLNVLGDFNLLHGAVDVNGRLNTGEAMIFSGLLTGRGTFNPTFLTSVDGIIAPGGLIGVGTLSIRGDVALASENELLIELGRTTGDQLRVLADPAQGTTGIISLGGDVWLSPSLTAGAPRHGNVYTIVLADGSVQNTFDDVNGFLGVLRPQLTYTASSVQVKLKAGSFLDLILHNPLLMPFALALDELRESHYNSLYNLYGEIDLMDPSRLSAAFSSMAPGSLMDAHGLLAMQSSTFGDTLHDRLSFLSRSGGAPLGLSVMGAPSQILAFGGDDGLGAASELSFASMVTEQRTIPLSGGLSAFFSGGYDESRSSAEAGRTATSPNEGLRTWHMIGGIEQTFGDVTVGIAGGYSRGEAGQQSTSALAESDLSQTAAYGVYRFDSGVYFSGLVGYGASRASTDRSFVAGGLNYQMGGDVRGDLFLASVEAGVNIDLPHGLLLTPNAGVRQYSMRMSGFTETGGAETALQIDEQRYGHVEARLGARLTGDFAFDSGWVLVPAVDAAAVSVLDMEEGGVWARFAAAPDVPFHLPGASRDDFWGEISGGLSLVRDSTSFSLRVETSVGREEQHQDRYMARYAVKF